MLQDSPYMRNLELSNSKTDGWGCQWVGEGKMACCSTAAIKPPPGGMDVTWSLLCALHPVDNDTVSAPELLEGRAHGKCSQYNK